MKSLFSLLLFIAILFSGLSFTWAQENPPDIPASELCGSDDSKRSSDTEASAGCLLCLGGQSLFGSQKNIESAKIGAEVDKETEEEKLRRVAFVYLNISHHEKEDINGRKIDYIWTSRAMENVGRALDDSKKPDEIDLKAIEGLFTPEECRDFFRQSRFYVQQDYQKLEERVEALKTRDLDELKKKSIKELRKFIEKRQKEEKVTAAKRKIPNVCGLENVEQLALYYYSQDYYRKLNEVMRNKSSDSEEYQKHAPFIKTLNLALGKLKDHKSIVYRGINLSDEQVKDFKEGEAVVFSSFSSASRRKQFSEQFSKSVGFVIQSKTGKYIQPFSVNKYEEEVLLPPGAKFKVIKKDRVGNRWLIELEEVVSARP